MLPIGSTLVAEKPIYNFLKERYIKILPILEFFSSIGNVYRRHMQTDHVVSHQQAT